LILPFFGSTEKLKESGDREKKYHFGNSRHSLSVSQTIKSPFNGKKFSNEQDTDNFLLECVLQMTIQAQHCILMNYPAMEVPDTMKLQLQANICCSRNLLSLDYLA
jgi:hypothetical protein